MCEMQRELQTMDAMKCDWKDKIKNEVRVKRYNRTKSGSLQWSACRLKSGFEFEFFTNIQSWQCWHYFQLCVPIYLQFSSLFIITVVSKYEIRNQWVYDHYILRWNATLDWLIFSDRAKTKLAMLAFLYCIEIVKNSSIRKASAVRGSCYPFERN